MSEKNHKRFIGYCKTPLLWKSDNVNQIKQFDIDFKETNNISVDTNNSIRLGKLVEQFVFIQLQQNKSISIIAKNLQIIVDKVTIGEIDCLIKYLNKYIHLEIIYKFYLYDEHINTGELDHWIGPNKKDSLVFKLNKLKNKQLPLINHFKTKDLLNKIDINTDFISSMVFFKAQLFVPKKSTKNTFKAINNKCIVGYYIGISEYLLLDNCYFYMPSKLDWLIEPHQDVDWISKINFTPYLEAEIKQSRSPLCWIKDEQNILKKIFIVFWKA